MFLASKIVLKPDQLQAIGAVAVESTYLERHVETLTWKLAKLSDQDGQHLTGRMMMDTRLDLLSSIALPKIKKLERKTEFRDIISKLKAANTERNIAIHGIWLWRRNELSLSELLDMELDAEASRRRPDKEPQKLAANKIIKTAESLADLNRRLGVFWRKEWPRLASKQKLKSQPQSQEQRPAPPSKPKGLLHRP